MSIKIKKGGTTVGIVNAFIKSEDAYANSVAKNLFIKVGGAYQSMLRKSMKFNSASNSQYIGAL